MTTTSSRSTRSMPSTRSTRSTPSTGEEARAASSGAPSGRVDLRLDPAPTAMVWTQPGRPHDAVAVPSVHLAPGDLLVAVELATICGSDVHTTRGDRGAPAPLVLGHEQVGRVAAAGEGAVAVDGSSVAVGQRVVWSLTVSCDRCATCRRGLPQKCEAVLKYGHERLVTGWELSGGFATHVHVRAGTAVVPVADDLDPALLAPVSCGTATARAALDSAAQITDLAGAVLLVLGGGLIGLTVTAMATDAGARVVVVDPDASRRALAARFGAVATASPTATPGSDDSVEHALGAAGGAPRVAVEASGSPHAVASALALLDTGGVAVLVGSVFPAPAVPLDAESVVRRLATIRGVHNYAPRHLVAAARFVEERHLAWPLAELVGETVTLADLDAGIAAAAAGGSVRVGVRPA
ncbi:alcohol dehydrogenase catalytic domain-containing protein [Frigoribacterium sp. PvP032]|uniref:alcohol dehydrogenase catalytic domain-containing protein n=1 Tax=Frigoribacterium sp. PvP032 TaxID=2806589 RepID=UPI001B55110E|nr:alcohol dehydrogenase catalytic domain-containing protein [Frigoribacterium sp. PvP032]MBP1189055.1 putative phosphonate catabolism associated alcohol dehydrogenase [Frigoribacterium sp. PvP032]